MNKPIVPDIIAQLSAVVGASHVLTGEDRAFYAHDVFRHRELPVAVVRPGSVAELQAVVKAAAAAGLAMLARGGGASYSDGYLPVTPHALIIDCGRLDRIVEINPTDGFVTVEAGVTWAALTEALAVRGLRTPFFGPFSGLVATVGGSVSQHSISHGSGAYGISADSVIALDVVLASGDVIRTGQGGSPAGHPFYRYYGPDLTGLFTGDCGAFGIKARITLKLIRRPAVADGVSFSFDRFEALHAAMAELAAAQLDDEHFALDSSLSQGQIARNMTLRGGLEIALGVLRNAANPLAAVRSLLAMGLHGAASLQQPGYFGHYIVTGEQARTVADKVALLRRLGARHGMPIANSVAKIVQAMPFAPLVNILGPAGERWVPLHGLLPQSQVLAFHREALSLLETHRPAMQAHGVHHGTMFTCAGPGAFLYEFALYWQDERTLFHDTLLGPHHVAGLTDYPANPEGKRLVEMLHRDLIALFHRYGAVHFQVGKIYPLLKDRDPAAVGLLRALKQALDPQGLMNPTVLGL